jgi:hypothetical protein
MTAQFGALAIASVIAGLSLSSYASAQERGAPEHDVAGPRTKPNSTLLKTGIVLIGVPYTASILVAATSEAKADRYLYIPVAGPWMDLSARDGARDCGAGQPCKSDGLNKGLLIANGLFQGVGALEVVGAFLLPEKMQPQGEAQKESLRVRVSPSSFAGGYGLVASGRFY